MDAVEHVLPKVEHRCCARHLYANWRKKHKNKELQKQFGLCAKSSNMLDFEANMEEIKRLTKVGFEDMLNCHPRHWCRAYFNIEVECDIIDNNLIEAFNDMVVEYREKNIYSMLEDIKKYVMHRLRDNKEKYDNWICDFGLRIRKKLYDNGVESALCHMLWNADNGLKVEYKGDTYVVDLKKMTCPCRS